MTRNVKKLALRFLLCLAVVLVPVPFQAGWAQGKTELTWYGHSAFKLVTPKGHVLYLDPWLTNPANPQGKADLEAVKQADLILVSHGHFDHVGDAVAIAKQTQARLVATFDLGKSLVGFGGFPKDRIGYDSMGNFGGTLSFFEGEVRVTFIPAVHGSSVNPHDFDASNPQDAPEYAGNPGGFLITIQDGPTVYHTGDTAMFSDMALIPKQHAVDVMLSCIGDHFTMGPTFAAEAVTLVNPKQVIPMHYGTFPGVLTGTVEAFRSALKSKKQDAKLRPLAIHEQISL